MINQTMSSYSAKNPEYQISATVGILGPQKSTNYSSFTSTGGGDSISFLEIALKMLFNTVYLRFNPLESVAKLFFLVKQDISEKDKSMIIEDIKWIRDITGLSIIRLGDLFGVTRQTIYLWMNGKDISTANQKKLFSIKEVLERAYKRNPSTLQMKQWLDTPKTINGITPFTLLSQGEFDKARLFAISSKSTVHHPPAAIYNAPDTGLRGGSDYLPIARPPSIDDELNDLFDDEDE